MIASKRIARKKARAAAAVEAREPIRMKAVAYVRVSTEEQAATGHGLAAQEESVRAFAKSQGYELVEVVVDAGVSGATKPADRPGFGRVLELAREKAFTVLLVYKFDRLAREIRFAVTTVAELAEQHEVQIRSVTEPIDTSTPMGRTLFAILAGMAENERNVITERTAGGRKQKAALGGFAGGRAPYGYERDLEGGLRIVPAQARIVRRIFEARRAGRTLQAIADELNAGAVPSANGKTWRPGTVAYVVDNPKYAGAVEYLFTWSGAETHVLVEGAHEPIVRRAA